jgi:hypothetical protein
MTNSDYNENCVGNNNIENYNRNSNSSHNYGSINVSNKYKLN